MKDEWFVIVNPAAGGGRARSVAPDRLKRIFGQMPQTVQHTRSAGHATTMAEQAYRDGYRRFVAVGGDGTTFEVINGLFPLALELGERPTLLSVPAGTGNSFLRDFGRGDLAMVQRAFQQGTRRTVDVARLEHANGTLFFLNIASFGFVADVCSTTNRRFKRLGEAGYALGVVSELKAMGQLKLRWRCVEGPSENGPNQFVSFSNSRFTGGNMEMAPDADPSDGKIDVIRARVMSRVELMGSFPKLFKGNHIDDDRVFASQSQRVELESDGPLDVMIDGEVESVVPKSISLCSQALEIVA